MSEILTCYFDRRRDEDSSRQMGPTAATSPIHMSGFLTCCFVLSEVFFSGELSSD